MKKLRVYQYLVGVLLLLNMAMIAFFIMTAPKHGRISNARMPHRILKLDKKQEIEFQKLAFAHSEELKEIKNNQKEISHTLFGGLIQPISRDLSDSLRAAIVQEEESKIQLHLAHFEDIKELLREDQMEYFEDFINALMSQDNFRAPPPKKIRN